MLGWWTKCWNWTKNGEKVRHLFHGSLYSVHQAERQFHNGLFSKSTQVRSPDVTFFSPSVIAARGKLDTLNMEFNKLVNEIKNIRLVSE